MENEQNKHELLKAWFTIKERKHNTLTKKIPRVFRCPLKNMVVPGM